MGDNGIIVINTLFICIVISIINAMFLILLVVM